MEINDTVIEKETGKRYTLFAIGKMKYGDTWYTSITYKNDSHEFYTRTENDFLRNFEKTD